MPQIDHTKNAKALLSANTFNPDTGESLIDVFIALGPDALKRLRQEGVVRTGDEVEDRFMQEVVRGGGYRPKFEADALQDEFAEWVNKQYQEVGKEYVHVYDMIALEAVIFDMSQDWLAEHACEGSVVDALSAFISKQELKDSLVHFEKDEISNHTLM
jgi:hypothetical protein